MKRKNVRKNARIFYFLKLEQHASFCADRPKRAFDDSIKGAGAKESGRASYKGSKIAGPRMAFIETERFLLTTNLKFKVTEL